MKTLIQIGKICNQMMTRKKLKRLGEVWTVDEIEDLGLEFVQKAERRFRSITQDMGAVLYRRMNLGFVDSQ